VTARASDRWGGPRPPAAATQALSEGQSQAPASRPAGRLGRNEPFAGRAANLARPTVFRADSEQLAGLYPFLNGASLPPVGAYVGWNTLTLEAFAAHPAAWVTEGVTTNANVLVTGVPGAGKSALIKALAFRLMTFGVRTLVLGDLKGEYTALGRHLGADPLVLGPGHPARINPLDAGPAAAALPAGSEAARSAGADIHRRRLTLLAALIGVRLMRRLTPLEESALSAAIRANTHACAGAGNGNGAPTSGQVHHSLRNPDESAARALGLRGIGEVVDKTEDVTHALANMLDGSLGGIFDGHSTAALDPAAPLQSVDISRLSGRSEDTIAMVLACLSTWGQAAVDASASITAVVRDEVWRQLRFPSLVRKVDADLRLQRAQGTIQLLATHRLSDFEAVGAAGSEEVAIARQLVGSFDTRVQLAQDTAALAMTKQAIGLTDAECALIASWGRAHRGRALWKVGRAGSFPVQLVLSGLERRLFHTDDRMEVA
jgi:type IV secretory pathway VirB4 component